MMGIDSVTVPMASMNTTGTPSGKVSPVIIPIIIAIANARSIKAIEIKLLIFKVFTFAPFCGCVIF